MFGISMWEMGLIILVALIFLGPRQLAETARVVGRLFGELQRLTSDVRNSVNWDSITSPEPPPRPENYKPPSSETKQAEKDVDLVPPPGEKSGPDFYADLLEKSREDAMDRENVKTPGKTVENVKD